MPTQLTQFQLRCEDALRKLLDNSYVGVSDRSIAESGAFVHLIAEGMDLEFWIYDDEAEVRSGKARTNFEAVIFHDESKRIECFLEQVRKHIRNCREGRSQ